ncbi:MAG TPA: AraC family transcriptional regulator [Pyrinomonadaceae bacterium]|nr:AraC family transcriptional regulator [Pyrinomonadaceae bacterium]
MKSTHGIAAVGGTLKRSEVAGLILTECSYPGGLRMSKHSHEPAFLSLVLRGRYTELIGGAEMRGRPGVLIAHPPERAHDVSFHAPETRIFRMDIRALWLERLRDYPASFESPACFKGGTPVSLALRLYREFRAEDKYSALAVEGILLEMLAEVSRRRRLGAERAVPRWLERAREILHERAAKVPSLSEIAAEVCVHPVHLAHEFRRHYRTSVGEYARRLRIEAACREVAHSDAPLSEIATSAGFYDQSHFSNAFKRHTGVTPSEFRAAARAH